MSALIKERPSADAVLAKAVLAAREQLGLTQLELAGIVGVDRSAISRWKTQGLRVDSKTGELALLLVRVYRALYALFGGHQQYFCKLLYILLI
ncbi:antitoxin Xre-like helix-turn-helix domain-containing protein, partial [Pseudomonas aeruginosa]|uniref:antitoxin Xre-like helix-turn-helix domain-containing protein n=1 Tax=Pseudomonas aeruginosa TaxID=287 RepID=UPI00396977FE